MMGKRVELHIPQEVWVEIRKVAAEHGTSSKRLARAIMLRSLEKAAGVKERVLKRAEAP